MKYKKAFRTYIKTSAVGLEFGLSIGIGAILGYFLDKHFHISPYGLIIGTLFGMAAGTKRLWTFVKTYAKKNGDNEDDQDY